MATDPASVVEAFVRAINQRDPIAIAELMTEDHTFIDSLGKMQSGRERMKAGWAAYFQMFPDYRMEVDQLLQEDSTFALFGSTTATFNGKLGPVAENRVGGPAAWKAVIEGEKIKVWQVYADWSNDMKVIEGNIA